MSVSIKPLEDRIVIKQVEAEQTTSSGLVIPDTAKEKPQEGEVVAVGPGRIDDNGNRIPLDVAVGDRVIYSKYGGTEVKFGGEDSSSCRLATCSRWSFAEFAHQRLKDPDASASGSFFVSRVGGIAQSAACPRPRRAPGCGDPTLEG